MYRYILKKSISNNLQNFHDGKMFDMVESIEKTSRVLDKYPQYYKTLIGYISGNCYYNGKISNDIALSEEEDSTTKDLDRLVMMTEPISKPLYLFHGFEMGMNYNDKQWKIGESIVFNFHLSKTVAFWVAMRFSNHFYHYWDFKKRKLFDSIPACYNIGYWSAIRTIFIQKYLFCIYEEENKWKHISTDIRCPIDILKISPSLIINEEFEYLSHKNEKFLLVDIVNKFSITLPFIKKFYIIKRID